MRSKEPESTAAATEHTSLLTDAAPDPQRPGPTAAANAAAPDAPTLTIKIPEGLNLPQAWNAAQESLAEAKDFAISGYLAAKDRAKKSPWILSIFCVVCCLGVVWAGLFGIVVEIVELSPMEALLKAYQVLFGLCVCLLEVSLYMDPLNLTASIHVWARILETATGRGLLQILPGTLAAAGLENLSQWLPGLALVAIGCFNVFYGLWTARQVRLMMEKMRDLEKERLANDRSGSGELSQVSLMVSKFQALDVNGTGKLSKVDLEQACQELQIALSESELERVFAAFDTKQKGYIDIKDFESWWFKSKAASYIT